MQKTLETVQATEGQSVDELERQLQENEKILDQMEDNLSGDVVQTLISVMLAIDSESGDGHMTDEEIDSLMAKVEALAGIDLNEDLLRAKLIEGGRSLTAVMEVIKNLLDNDTPPEENIFNFVHPQ